MAILSVVAYHVLPGWVTGGFVGVDVFFVISGYLIGSLVYTEIRSGDFSTVRFYARRAKRILPALFGVLIFTYVAALLLLPPSDVRKLSWSVLSALTSSSNFYFWRSFRYFFAGGELSPLLMTWSLGIEEQYYLLFPMLMLLTRKLRWQTQVWGMGGLAALSLTASIWGTKYHPQISFYLLPTRAWELAAGVLLAVVEANREKGMQWPPVVAHGFSILGFGLIASAVVLLGSETPFPGYAALIPVFGAVFIIASRSGVVNRGLSWRPMVFVGLVSYSWYLWHWPLLSFTRIVFDAPIPPAMGISIGLLSFVLAVLSYRFVEQPFRTSMTPAPRLLRRYAAALAVVALPAAVFCATGGLPKRNLAVRNAELIGVPLWLDQCLVFPPIAGPPLHAPCVPPGRGRTVALIGDSHAAALADALRSIANRSGYRVVELTRSACPSLEGASPAYAYPEEMELAAGCSEFNRESLAYIRGDASIEAVVIAGYWSRPFHPEAGGIGYFADGQPIGSMNQQRSWELLRLGLDQTVADLERAGKRVYLVQDNAAFSFSPWQLKITRSMPVRRGLASLLKSQTLRYIDDVAPELEATDAELARGIVSSVAAARPGTHLIDSRNAFCGPDGCKFAERGQELYVDEDHLSRLGAEIALAGLKLP